MLELNEKNVNDIYNKAYRSEKSPGTLIVFPGRPGASPVYLSSSALLDNVYDIYDLAHQLKVWQQNRDFKYDELAYAYNNIPWTYNQEMVDKLFYLLKETKVFTQYPNTDTFFLNDRRYLKIKLDRFPTMRLTEENISKIMRAGFRKDDSAESTIKIYAANDYPSIYFDNDVLVSTVKDITNMFGQTKVIHDQTPVFDMEDLAVLYDGSVWTKDPTYLQFLYYLLRGCSRIAKTERRGPTRFKTIGRIAPTFFEEDRR